MNRTHPPVEQPRLFVEALEPRIAPAGLLNENKFTSVVAGGTLLLDASDPNGFQGLSTGFGANSGSYLLYITAGKALIFTSDLNGDGLLEPNEITGIAAGKDAQGRSLDLIAFTDINGDIATNLLPGTGVSSLTDSDNNPLNGRDGRILLDNGIHSITLRSLTASDIDTSIPGNTVLNRSAPTHYSIFGNIYTGGDFGAPGAGLTIDGSGSPQIGDIYTGTAANNHYFRFQITSGADIQNTFLPFTPKTGEHGADIIGVHSADPTQGFSLGTLATGSGGLNARGGNLQEIVLRGDHGGYQLIAGDGGAGATGAVGGSIINFADLGSITSQVILHTGNGGVGLLGAGGAGGTATFATSNIAGNLKVILGNGGNGFSAGGAGAGQTTAVFTPPESTDPLTGTSVLGTYHAPGDIGTLHPTGVSATGQILFGPHVIDFNGDGIGDAVFATSNPDQIVIVFGDPNNPGSFLDNTGAGFVNSNRAAELTVYLDAPNVVTRAITVGDFNGDGKLDIAAASSDPGNAAGISVFLNQIGDNVHNPLGGTLFTGNPLGDHPFSEPLRSPLPIGATPIYALAAGDFNGDGVTDLAVGTNQFVTFLFGDTSPNAAGVAHANGYFYGNVAAIGQPGLVLTIRDIPIANANIILQATASVANSGSPDVLIYSTIGATVFRELSVAFNPLAATPNTVIGLTASSFSFGSVDTNRNLGTPTNQAISLQTVTAQDFTIQDFNSDGVADVVAISKQPASFIATYQGAIGLQGNLTFNFSATIPGAAGGDNNGIRLLDNFGGPSRVVPIDRDPTTKAPDGIFNQVGILTDAHTVEVTLPDPTTNLDNSSPNAVILNNVSADSLDVVAPFDTYYFDALGSMPSNAYALAKGTSFRLYGGFGDVLAGDDDVFGTFRRYLTNNGVRIFAGDGGNAISGAAGAGGTIGSATPAISNTAGSVQVLFPANTAYRGEGIFVAGNGGNGFGGGGMGGDVQNVNVRYAGTTITLGTELVAGDGGNGINGDGGRGGNLSQFSVDVGTVFVAGNGGNGLKGGQGGSVLGNQAGIFDTRSPVVTAIAGIGGLGVTSGGAGGNISQFNAVYTSAIFTSLLYISGNGGSAAAGIGGNGGGILNSSPNNGSDFLAGPLSLQAGAGGNGLIGGDGGAITNFVNQATSPTAVPTRLLVIAGKGGIGVNSQGGAGGTITNFRSNTIGQSGALTRILAGDGGASFGTIGGAGGSINSVTAQSTGGPIAVVAGAGGDGVTNGGIGGSVTNSVVNSAAQILGKVLVIAGAGGDAIGATRQDIVLTDNSNPNDLAHAILALGGVSGIAGDGGNITNFTQPVSVQTAVDLIAGNGGSTINYGTTLSGTTGVGRGGSISNIILTGTVGASTRDPNTGVNPPIRSYIDADNNGVDDVVNGVKVKLADFVQNVLQGTVDSTGFFTPATAAGVGFQLTNAVGNVGIVAGVAGQVQGSQPARDGVNGSVQTVTAGSIMSIIAGSVNSVSPVSTLSGISVRNLDGVFGADKSLPNSATVGNPNNIVEYFDPVQGRIVSNLQPGYRLIDGAIYTQNIVQPVPQSPRLFVFAQG